MRTRPVPSPLKCSEDAPTRPEPRADVDLSSKKSMRCSWLGAECVVETLAPATGEKAERAADCGRPQRADGGLRQDQGRRRREVVDEFARAEPVESWEMKRDIS